MFTNVSFENEIRLGVSQFNELINSHLNTIGEVVVEGEITELNISSRGGVNVVLKDTREKALVSITGYAPRIEGIKYVEVGMQVAVWGTPQVYSPYGKFSVSVYKILPIGEGALNKAIALLKEKLNEEGLFNSEKKRPLPELVSKIALITARDSAAQGDFYKILKENSSAIAVDFYPVSVQGKYAVQEILKALKASSKRQYDAVIVIRGGGSLEDLSAFNDEKVSREVFANRNVTMVAVGHERDESIAEYAADIRASTPSQAAYYLIANNYNFLKALDMQLNEMFIHIDGSLSSLRYMFEKNDLYHNTLNVFRYYESKLLSFNMNFTSSLSVLIGQHLNIIKNTQHSLMGFYKDMFQIRTHIDHLHDLIRSYNPQNVVNRGYAIIKSTKGEVISSSKEININENINILMKDGQLSANIDKIH